MSVPLRVVVISHSCVLPLNQRLFAALAAHGDLDVNLIAPRHWVSSLQGPLDFAALPELANRASAWPVRRPGDLHRHTYPDLPRALSDLRPEVLYLDEDAHSLVASQVLRLQRALGFRLIVTPKQNVYKRYLWPFGRIERAIYRVAAAAAATSEECLTVARRKGFDGPAVLVHYVVDTDLFVPGGPPGPRPFTVGYAGRLVLEKGLFDLLAAFDQMPTGQLRIAGSGPLDERLELLADTKFPPGTVHVEPALPHEAMPAWYRQCDVVVLPSRTTSRWKEQFGRVLAEAQACGVPVVGSDSGFIPELLATTGGGVVYPEGDVVALAAALRQLSDDPARRRELGAAGRAGVLAHYSPAVLADRLHGLIHQMAMV